MTLSRKPMFWIDVGLVGLSIVLCAASIVSSSSLGLGLFVVGAALFLPAAVRLAARLSPQDGAQGPGDAKAPIRKRPILDASLSIALGLIGLGNEWLRQVSSGAGAAYYAIAGAFVLLIGWGIFGLVKALLQHKATQISHQS